MLIEILESEKIKDKEAVLREIDKLDKLPEQDVKANLKKLGAEKIIELFKKPESYFKKFRSYEEIAELERYCDFYNVRAKFQPSLARGLGYYTGSIFEIKAKEMDETILAGGTYAVNGIQASGISFGLDRISKLADVKIKERRIIIASINKDREAVKLASRLRGWGISVVQMYKVTNALEYANSLNIPYVVFLGENEVKARKFKLRDMKTGKEKMLSEAGLLEELKAVSPN